MKQITLGTNNAQKFKMLQMASLIAIILAMMTNSCKKDLFNEELSQPQQLKLQEWYAKERSSISNSTFSEMKPIWEKTFINQQAKCIVYEITLTNPDQIFVRTGRKTTNEKLEKLAQKNVIKLLIFEDKQNGELMYACYMSAEADLILPDNLHYKQVGNLNGKIMFFDMHGRLANGWQYVDGKITEKIAHISREEFLANVKAEASGTSTKGYQCKSGYADVYKWGCITAGGKQTCSLTRTGTEYVTSCSYNEEEEAVDHIENEDGSGGEYMPPIYYDCANVKDGTAYINSDCQTCMGGTTGITECPPAVEIKNDSLKKYYPCMVKEVLDKLSANQAYGKLIQPFQNITLPNGAKIYIPGLPNLTFGFSAQPYGGSSNDYMFGSTSDGGGYSSKIEFNSQAINNASKLFLQMAAIHEAAHAYSRYYIKSGSWGHPIDTTRYSTWAMNIANFESVAKSELEGGNFNDHSLFIENYVDNFVKILKETNGSSFTDKEYQMAAIYGLNNPGDRTYSYLGSGFDLYIIYKNKLEKSYNKLLAKYGITPAQRDAFYLANLVSVPPSHKLPNNCP